jgi:hypothetical protein
MSGYVANPLNTSWRADGVEAPLMIPLSEVTRDPSLHSLISQFFFVTPSLPCNARREVFEEYAWPRKRALVTRSATWNGAQQIRRGYGL